MKLNNKTILVTGGTGSFGQKFVETALKHSPKKVFIQLVIHAPFFR